MIFNYKNIYPGGEKEEGNITKHKGELSQNGDIPVDCRHWWWVSYFHLQMYPYVYIFIRTKCYFKCETKAMNELKPGQLLSPFCGPFF